MMVFVFLNERILQEQSLKHMMKQLHRTEAAHVRRLERSYVEEAARLVLGRCDYKRPLRDLKMWKTTA